MAEGPEPAWQARTLLRGARAAVLATADREGAPHAALVTPAWAPELSGLLWLSRLSAHTSHLAAEPRCALFVQGPAVGANPQTAPRVSLAGRAAPVEDEALKARWLAIHPYAALYAGFTDFALWRVVPSHAQLVGGFGRAFRLPAAELGPDPATAAAFAAAEATLIAAAEAQHASLLQALGTAAAKSTGQDIPGRDIVGPWRLVALDSDGIDLATPTASLRLHWPAPLAHPEAVAAAWDQLAGGLDGAGKLA